MPIDVTRDSPAKFAIRLSNDLSEIVQLAETVDEFGSQNGVPTAVIFNFNLALEELVSNIINYGYADRAGAHEILISVAVADNVMTVDIVDDARLFNPLEAPEPDIGASLEDRPIGGLGLHLVKSMMDDVRYESRDNRNHMTISKAF